MQGLIYAWLLQKNGLPATKCRFIALLKDHSKTEAERDHSYPQSPVYVYEFDITKEALEETESFIRKKVFQYELFSSSEDNTIPECSAEERWQKKDVYAVKKEGRKAAVKLFDTKEEAEAKIAELGKGHFLEVRKGESMKCKNYCLCARKLVTSLDLFGNRTGLLLTSNYFSIFRKKVNPNSEMSISIIISSDSFL